MSSRKPWIDQSVKTARLVALLAHREQTYGDKPYIYHLDMVTHILGHFGYKGEMIQAGFLHDVLEDTNIKAADLTSVFGSPVTKLVESVTGVGENRKARNADIYRKLQKAPFGKPLKIADRIANIHCTLVDGFKRELFPMYQAEHDEFAKYVLYSAPDRIVGEYNRLITMKKPIDWLVEK